MRKKLLLTLIICIMTFMANSAFAYTEAVTPLVAQAIRKYKQGNITGCIQDLTRYVRENKNVENQIVYYYLGMAYTRAGYQSRAEYCYFKANNLNPNNTLGKYAERGYYCVKGDPACYAPTEQKKVQEAQTDLDKFINAPYGNGLSADLNKEIERKRIERLRKEMNSDEELNKYEFKDFRDFANKRGSIETNTLRLLAQTPNLIASSQPSDEEVLKAIRVLNDAGLSNIAKQAEMAQQAQNSRIETAPNNNAQVSSAPEVKSEYKPDVTREEFQRQMQRDMMTAQMSQYSQPNIGMLFGEKNSNNNNNNNNMMNMLPFLMAQQAQQQAGGQANGQMQFTPEMLQTMMFSQMMPNLDFGSGNNN